MSPSGVPIQKHQLGTFFAAENEKECGEGVTQCQQYIGDIFQFSIKYISSNISLCNALTLSFFVSRITFLFLYFRLSSLSVFFLSSVSPWLFFFLQGCLQDILEWSTLEFVIIIAISCGCALVELMSICIGIYVLKHLRRRSFQK